MASKHTRALDAAKDALWQADMAYDEEAGRSTELEGQLEEALGKIHELEGELIDLRSSLMRISKERDKAIAALEEIDP